MKPEQLLNALGEIDDRHLTGILPQTPAAATPELYPLGGTSDRPKARAKTPIARRAALIALCAVLCLTAILSLFLLPYLVRLPVPDETEHITEDPPPTDDPWIIPSAEQAPYAPLPAYENAPYTAQELYTLLYGQSRKYDDSILLRCPQPYNTHVSTQDSIAALPAPLTGDTVPIYRIHSLQYTEDVMDALANASEPAIRAVLHLEATDTIEWKTAFIQEYEGTEDTAPENASPDSEDTEKDRDYVTLYPGPNTDPNLDLYASVHSVYTYEYNENISIRLSAYPGFYTLTFYLQAEGLSDLVDPPITETDANVFFYDDPDGEIYQSARRSVRGLIEALGMEITDHEITRSTAADMAGYATVTLYGKESPSGAGMEALDTYGESWYSNSKRTSIALSYESTAATEASMVLHTIYVTVPVTDTYTKEDELPLISLAEAEYLLACGCVTLQYNCRCRICLADRSETDMTDYDTVTMEYIRCPDEGLLIPCYVFWKYLYDENGRSYFAKASVPAIPVSGLEDYYRNDPSDHDSFCTPGP